MSHWPISILSILSSLVSLALPLVLVRVLDPTTLGAVKIFFLYLMVLPPLTFIAGVSSGLSYWAGRGEEGRKATRVSGILFLVLSALSLIIILFLSHPIARALNLEHFWVILFAYALSFTIASMFYDEAAIASGRIWMGAIFNASFELLRTASIVIVAWVTRDVVAIIEAHIVVQSLKVVVGYGLAFRQDLVRWEWQAQVYRAVVRYAVPVSFAFIVGLGLNYSDQMILSRLISPADFALYAVCCLTFPPLLVLEASVTRVLIPKMSAHFSRGEPNGAAQAYRKAVKDLSYFVIPVVAGMIVFATPIVEVLFTKTYLEGAPFLRLYALWYLSLVVPPDSVARAQGKAKWILVNFTFFSILTIGACYGLARSYGAMGALSGLLLARFASRVYTVFWIQRSQRWKLNDFLPLRPMAMLLTFSVLLSVAALECEPLFVSKVSWLFVCGTAFALGYFYLTIRFPLEVRRRGGKVLMLTPGLYVGGLERMILNLSRSLKLTSEWVPEVWAYDFESKVTDSDLLGQFAVHEIPVHARSKPPRFSLKTVYQIAKHAAQEQVSVIHTHDLGALIYGVFIKVALLAKVRLVHTQHSFVHLHRSWKYKYYEKFFTRFADTVVAVSRGTRESYLSLGVRASKVVVIANGVDLPDLPALHGQDRIQQRMNLFEGFADDFWILYLARVHGGKGQDHAVKLWNELSPKVRESSVLFFVGPESEVGALHRLNTRIASALDPHRLVVVGVSQNPQRWIHAADLFLSCSEFEGMPLAPIEALGSGLPGVLSEIPGHEFLRPYCRLFSLSRPMDGARAVEAVFEESREILFWQGTWEQSTALRKSHALGAMSRAYAQLYEGLKVSNPEGISR